MRLTISLIVIAELFGTALWFSPNAVSDSLAADWELSTHQLGYLTAAVQSGFIIGTLVFSISGLADRFAASRLFMFCAVLGALLNGLFAVIHQYEIGLALRFVTGICLAGIYPIGMKLVVSWAPDKAGQVLGWLVGMLTIGTGLPHLVRGAASQWDWQWVIWFSSLLAIVAAVVIFWLGDGPHLKPNPHKKLGAVIKVFTNARFRAAALGYFGHMWELYAFWTLVPLLVAATITEQLHWQYTLAFVIFLAGGVGCVSGGRMSRRWGSAKVAALALIVSGSLCVLFPLLAGVSNFIAMGLLIIWGTAVVADSPQFSALAAKSCPPELTGSALSIMNSIGFFITIISIDLVTALWQSHGYFIVLILAPGPFLGLLALIPALNNDV